MNPYAWWFATVLNALLEATLRSLAHWPRGAKVHVAPRGQCANPLRSPQLKR